MKIPKQEYVAEFNELSVNRVKACQSPGAVVNYLELIEQALRNWVEAANAGRLKGTGGKVVTSEQMEPSRLRAENVRLPFAAVALNRVVRHNCLPLMLRQFNPTKVVQET